MFSKLELLIASRYLRSKRKEGFISINAGFSLVGIALGVATLIVVMAVMNGFRTEITSKILGLGGHINLYSYSRELNDFDQLVKEVKNTKGVVEALPMIEGQAMATKGQTSKGVLVKGIKPEDLNQKKLVTNNIILGNLNDYVGQDAIAIGSQLAISMGLSLNDELTLISPEGNVTAIGTLPRLKKYKIVAIFEAGMYEYDSSVVLMPLEAAQIFYKYPDSVNTIEITTNDPHNSRKILTALDEKTKMLYRLSDWQMANASLFNALKVERNVMFLILTLIVLIAAFNIISSLIMLVNDKNKNIAILRTMGATKSSITKIFVLCGAAIGVIGTFTGFILGLAFSLNIDAIQHFMEKVLGQTLFDPVIYFLSELPAEVRADDVISIVLMSLALSFLATIYPALKAAKLDPAEVLRYE